MYIIGSLILTTALVMPTRLPAGDDNVAITALVKATYVETGLDKKVKKWEVKYIPEKIRIYGGWTSQIIKIQQEKKISYEWTF